MICGLLGSPKSACIIKDKTKFKGYTEVHSLHNIKLDKCPFPLTRNNVSFLISLVSCIDLCLLWPCLRINFWSIQSCVMELWFYVCLEQDF